MASTFIPALSPVAKAAKGWPSSPNVKPNVPVEIDWSNSLARGLTAAIFPELNLGITKQHSLTRIGSDTSISHSDFGRSLFWATPTDPSAVEITPNPFVTNNFTWVALITREGTPADNSTIVLNESATYTGANSAQFRFEETGYLSLVQPAVAVHRTSTTLSVADGETAVVGLTFSSGSTCNFFKNGAVDSGSATATFTSGSTGNIGASYNLAQYNMRGHVGIVLAWDRVLSDAEASEVTRNINQLFKPANTSPTLLADAPAPSVTQGAIPASSPIVRALRGFDGG